MTIAIALAPTYPRREIIFALFATRTNKNKFSLQPERRGEERGSSKLELAKKRGKRFFPPLDKKKAGISKAKRKKRTFQEKMFLQKRPTDTPRSGRGGVLFVRFALCVVVAWHWHWAHTCAPTYGCVWDPPTPGQNPTPPTRDPFNLSNIVTGNVSNETFGGKKNWDWQFSE